MGRPEWVGVGDGLYRTGCRRYVLVRDDRTGRWSLHALPLRRVVRRLTLRGAMSLAARIERARVVADALADQDPKTESAECPRSGSR